MKQFKINHLAVWLCIILATVIGFLWYGPIFGDKWMGMVGLNPEEVAANPPGAGIWITNTIATIIPMYVLAWIFTKIGVTNAIQGATYGFVIAFAFVLMSRMTSDMFAANPYGLTWIVAGNNLLIISLAGLILGGWQKK